MTEIQRGSDNTACARFSICFDIVEPFAMVVWQYSSRRTQSRHSGSCFRIFAASFGFKDISGVRFPRVADDRHANYWQWFQSVFPDTSDIVFEIGLLGGRNMVQPLRANCGHCVIHLTKNSSTSAVGKGRLWDDIRPNPVLRSVAPQTPTTTQTRFRVVALSSTLIFSVTASSPFAN